MTEQKAFVEKVARVVKLTTLLPANKRLKWENPTLSAMKVESTLGKDKERRMENTNATQALLGAATIGDFEQVRRLVQAGADLNALDGGEPLLDRAVSAFTLADSVPAFAAEMLRLLLQLGADPNFPGDEGMTALHSAMLKQNVELMQVLLEGGAAPNDMPGFSPGETLYDWAEFDYRYSTWDEPFEPLGSLMPPDAPTADDEANEDAWLFYLDRCAVKHGARRPDYLFLLREFGARTARELGRL